MSASTALTIGHFDGVHRGHCHLVDTARNAVGASGQVVVLSFDPHPLTRLRPEAAPGRLSHFEQRREWLIRAGADEVHALVPTPDRLRQSPESFLKEVAEQYQPDVIVEGPDFHFGRNRAGNIQTLADLQSMFGYRSVVVDPVETTLVDHEKVRVSSTLTRWLIRHGRVVDAAMMLGRPYELAGTVVQGDQRGREIGFPTTNLDCRDQLLPAEGIYAGVAEHPDGNSYIAAISVGTKPTFGEHALTCEAFLLDYDGPLNDYNWTMRLSFRQWIRDQIRFDGLDPLLDQMRRDIERVRAHVETGGVMARLTNG